MKVVSLMIAVLGAQWCISAKENKTEAATDLEKYIAEAQRVIVASEPASPGSLFSASAPLVSLGTDFRASRLNDLVTIVVQERASALSKGTVDTARASSAKSSVTELAGRIPATGALANLANLGSETSLSGEGTTTRETVLSTALSARVAHVLPNGNLIIEGVKNVTVNSETQTVMVRGIVRPVDLTTSNTVVSDRIAAMEIRVNGKGVVQDAIRRPFFLYRILLGLLPF